MDVCLHKTLNFVINVPSSEALPTGVYNLLRKGSKRGAKEGEICAPVHELASLIVAPHSHPGSFWMLRGEG